MKEKWNPEILVGLLIPFFLVLLLGVLPRPVKVGRALVVGGEALIEGRSLIAAENLARAAAALPWRDGLWETAGRAALEGGDARAAIEYLTTARGRGSITPEGLLALGDAHNALGQDPAAIDSWRAALEAGASPVEVHERLYQHHRERGKLAAAIDALKAITAHDPGNAQARYQLGLMLAAQEPEAALAHLIQAVELNEDLTKAVAVVEGKIREARFSDDPAYALLNAGRALAFLDEWALAAEAFRRATESNPDYAEAWAFLGEAREKLGEDGRPALEKALALDPDSFTVNTLYGLYWSRQGESELALVYLHAAAAIKPENPAIEAEIGKTLHEMGDIPAALSHFERATQLAPRDATYWRLLSRYALQNGFQIEAIGLAAARQARLLDPDDPIALDLLGYGYYLLDDLSLAARFLHQSISFDAQYAPAHLHLGLVHLAQGEPDAARQHLVQAIDLAPDSPTAVQAQRVLDRFYP